jgi:transcriptional regulator with XRE-family HTH domain
MNNDATESATMERDPYRDAIAAEVRAEIARQGKTQREVAALIDLPQPSLQLRLKGDRPFRAEELVKLAEAFGVPADRFLPEPPSTLGPTKPGLAAVTGGGQ